MTTFTHTNAPTQFVDAADIRFAFRRFGKQTGIPLVLLQHFTGNLDSWDPAVLDGFAKDREIIIFNNRGIASTNGVVPTTYADYTAIRTTLKGTAADQILKVEEPLPEQHRE